MDWSEYHHHHQHQLLSSLLLLSRAQIISIFYDKHLVIFRQKFFFRNLSNFYYYIFDYFYIIIITIIWWKSFPFYNFARFFISYICFICVGEQIFGWIPAIRMRPRRVRAFPAPRHFRLFRNFQSTLSPTYTHMYLF